jgi:hypothetical protein
VTEEEGRNGTDAIIFRLKWYRAKEGCSDFHICWENEEYSGCIASKRNLRQIYTCVFYLSICFAKIIYTIFFQKLANAFKAIQTVDSGVDTNTGFYTGLLKTG